MAGISRKRDSIQVLVVIGTRPEAIKLAPVVLELRRRPTFSPRVCLTAQHRALLDEPLALFGIQADHDLDLMQSGQDPISFAGRALPGLRQVLRSERPDVVLVQGDTTSALCGGLVAFHEQVRLGHVEAGLRTGRRLEPFPEEMNRRLLGRLATWHFAPTAAARQALLGEGVEEPCIFVCGNTVVDAVLQVARMAEPADLSALEPGRRLVLLTCHRREHFGAPLRGVLGAVREIVRRVKDIEVVFPVHPNPEVVAAVRDVLAQEPRVHLIPPAPYRSFVALLQRSSLVLTDSGGVQEEAPSFGVPVLVLRRATEREEGRRSGNALLVGTEPEEICREAVALLTQESRRQSMTRAANPYGDGQAAARIADALEAEIAAVEWLAAGDPRGPTPAVPPEKV